MKAIIALAIIGIALCHSGLKKDFVINSEYLEGIKKTATFETYSHEEHPFKNWSESQLRGLMGLQQISLKDTSNMPYDKDNDLPVHFDSREQWPDCIHPIRDQGHCGSCWAHAASEVLSDRFCIASNGKVNVVLSPEDFVSCDWLDHGCNGGILTTSWLFLQWKGLVTDECKPYTSGDGTVPWCALTSSKCTAEGVEYKKYYAKTHYSPSTIEAIKDDIYHNGPVETGFTVYDDFMSYKDGVYKRTSDKVLGGHAVKIVGWGKEDDTEYWIVANSWSPSWGIQGYFKIAFGECGIENVIAGTPLIQ
jgi:cathepsin B